MDSNWRKAVSQDSRTKIVKRIMDTLQRRMLVQGQDGVNAVRKTANRFEEEMFFLATDKYDYIRKISLKMLNLEMKAPNPPNSAVSSNANANQSSANKPSDATTMMQHSMRNQTTGQVQFWPEVPQPTQIGMQSSASTVSSLSGVNNVPQQTSVLHSAGQGSNNVAPLNSMPQASVNSANIQGLSQNVQTMDSNWRMALSQDSRTKLVNRIVDALQRRMLVQGQDGVNELWKVANRFEEKMFFAATDKCDYLRKIALKMLNLEMKAPNPPNSAVLSSARAKQSSANKPLDASNTSLQ